MTDSCPICQRPDVEPVASRTDGTQLTDRYRCPRCGHGWITRRDTAAYQDYDPATDCQPAA